MSDKKEAVRRRRARESIWELVAALPSPFGMHALSCYSELSAWSQQQQQGDTSHALLPGQYPEQSAAHAEGSPVVDWNSMPVSCEPCALLSNPANRGKKHGKNVLEQISMISFEESSVMLDRRGLAKRWQVESFVLVLRRLIESDPSREWHVVDFGCGTGALLLPLACLFPSCRFTGVEMKPAALAILRSRAAAAKLPNVHTYLGMIEAFEPSFDVCLALHACGNATDVALLRAERVRAAYVVSPCCVGKLKFSMQGGSSFSGSGGQWKWMPRLAGSEEQLRLAGSQLLTAAGGDAEHMVGVPHSGLVSAATRPGDLEGHVPVDVPAAGAAANSVSHVPVGVTAAGAVASSAANAPFGVPAGADARSIRRELLPLSHPRSAALSRVLPEPELHFRRMAQVADTNHHMDTSLQRARQTCSSGGGDRGSGGGGVSGQHCDMLSAARALLQAASVRGVAHGGGGMQSVEREQGVTILEGGGGALAAACGAAGEAGVAGGGVAGGRGWADCRSSTEAGSSVRETFPGKETEPQPAAAGTAAAAAACSQAARVAAAAPATASARATGSLAAAAEAEAEAASVAEAAEAKAAPAAATAGGPAESCSSFPRPITDADISHQAAHCALAKLHVELDRNEAAREAGYGTGIFRMLHAGCMAKGDLLVGVPAERKVWKHLLALLQPPHRL